MVSLKVARKQPPVFIMRPIKVKICRDALRVNFPGNWMTLSSPVNFTDGNAAKQTKSFGSLLSRLQVLRLNEFCPSFHNWQRCVIIFFPPAASSSKNKLSLLLYLTYLNVQQPGETIFKPFPSKVLFQLNSAADRRNGSALLGIYLFKREGKQPGQIWERLTVTLSGRWRRRRLDHRGKTPGNLPPGVKEGIGIQRR